MKTLWRKSKNFPAKSGTREQRREPLFKGHLSPTRDEVASGAYRTVVDKRRFAGRTVRGRNGDSGGLCHENGRDNAALRNYADGLSSRLSRGRGAVGEEDGRDVHPTDNIKVSRGVGGYRGA
ncbi:Hypothetical protein CINCED_3A018375 [Cinara cedri]|uniref:Uncharacterized protein n=1 Tax=Cinara cedri TaxID=506608 RepID=A0A5E4NLK3_9HEMI|nr:Hypothetical protein CINCED_3A018375 [Cinara cedri]